MNRQDNLKRWDELQEKYPNLFPTKLPLEIGMGWMGIVDKACKKISKAVKRDSDYESLHLTQVKEKFGGLRMYLSWGENYNPNDSTENKVQTAIREAEESCKTTCETCGKAGRASKGGWIRIICDPCERNRFK